MDDTCQDCGYYCFWEQLCRLRDVKMAPGDRCPKPEEVTPCENL